MEAFHIYIKGQKSASTSDFILRLRHADFCLLIAGVRVWHSMHACMHAMLRCCGSG